MTTLCFRARFVSAAALAGVMSGLLLHAADRADARTVVLTQCQQKHAACVERCIMRIDAPGKKGMEMGNACIKRTCDKQHPGCGSASLPGGKGGKRVDPGSAGKPPAAGGANSNPSVTGGTTPRPYGAGSAPRVPGGVKVTTTGSTGGTAPRSGGSRKSGAR